MRAKAKPPESPNLKDWLRRLDSYTNAEFGHALSMCEVDRVCVACGERVTAKEARGLCTLCAAKRRPDDSEVVFFRPLHRRAPEPR